MATLITCDNCGKKVSSSVTHCPHCNNWLIKVNCNICGGRLKESEYDIFTTHKTCFVKAREVILSKTFQCHLCHSQITYRYVEKNTKRDESYPYINCPECGEKICLKICIFCHIGISSQDLKMLETDDFRSEPNYGFRYRGDLASHLQCIPQRIKDNQRSKNKCWIATATYGEDSLEVFTLRVFRDRYLRNTQLGRYFIICYENISPFIAKIIMKYPLFRLFVRKYIVTPAFWIAGWFNSK